MAALATTKVPTVAECDAMICKPGTLFEIEEITINGLKQKCWKNIPVNHRKLLVESMEKWKDLRFLSAPLPEPAPLEQRENVTFGEVHQRALALAAWLTGHGVKEETRVGVVGWNSINWVIAFTAVHLLGAVPVLVNAAVQPDSMVHCLNLVGPKLVLCDAPTALMIEAHKKELKSVGPSYSWADTTHMSKVKVKTLDFANMKVPASAIKHVAQMKLSVGHDSDGVIFYTSGTTGFPKAVLLSQRAALHNGISGFLPPLRAAIRMGLPAEAVIGMATAPPEVHPTSLLAVPFFHATGCLSILLRGFQQGSSLVLMRRWNVDEAIRLIVDHKITQLGGVPAVVTSVLQSPKLPKDWVFDGIGYGGANPPARLPKDIHDRWPAVMPGNGWGMTELSALHCANYGADYIKKPKSCGPPIPICSVRVVDDKGRDVPAGTVGTIFARGPNTMKCYIGDDAATRKTLFPDGWLDTGDAGYLDAEGWLHISDRIKDIIIRGAENIASEEVENALYQDDRIAEAAAVPVPDYVLGELVAAAVSLRPGAKATPEEIMEAVRGRVRSHARPVFIWVSGEELPRNVNGKLIKKDIKVIVQDMYKKEKRASKL